MIYFASPYSHPNKEIVRRRFVAAVQATAAMLRQNIMVFSPIAYSHVLAEVGQLGGDWSVWSKMDTEFIRMCGSVLVLTLSGWDKSVGIAAEVRYAKCLDIPVKYITPEELGVEDVLIE